MSDYGANPIPIWHLIPVLAIALVMFVNVATSRAFTIFQSRRDSRRHRAAIAAELASLHALVRENLRLIREEAGFVLSLKSSTSVYRGTMGRLTSFREHEIAAVVGTYTTLERLESLAAARAKPAPGIYRFEGGKAEPVALRREYHRAAAGIEKTLAMLRGEEALPVSIPRAAPVPASA